MTASDILGLVEKANLEGSEEVGAATEEREELLAKRERYNIEGAERRAPLSEEARASLENIFLSFIIKMRYLHSY